MYANMLETVRVSRQDQRVGTSLTLVGKTYRLRRYWRHTVLVSYARTHTHSLTHTEVIQRGSKKEFASVYIVTRTGCLQFMSWAGRPKEMEQLKHTLAIWALHLSY